MANSLITGAAGFIGSHVVDHAIKMGHHVVALDDLSGGFRENVNENAEFVQGSVNDALLINELFKKYKFDFVFHLAAYAAEGLSHFIKVFNYNNNLIGSVNLINASVNTGTVKCFVFTSSIAVYGRGQVPMKEETVPVPEDPYGIAKLAVEYDLKESLEIFGLNYVIFRPHNVYGERQNIGDKYRNVIGIFMNQLMQGAPLTIFGDGMQTRAFSYIDDVAPIIAHCVERPQCYNNVFNIGADKPYSVLELAKTVGKVLGSSFQIKHLESRNEVVDAYSDHTKVKQHFGALVPNIQLEEGLRRMADWVIRHGARKTSRFKNIEVYRKLPASWLEE